jgi:hypothetical protein
MRKRVEKRRRTVPLGWHKEVPEGKEFRPYYLLATLILYSKTSTGC